MWLSVVLAAVRLAVVLLVISFGSSSNLAAAYGIAVTGAMFIDTVLLAIEIRLQHGSRVIRGGNWANAPEQTRAAWRQSQDSDTTNARIGFRLVRGI